MRMLVVTLLILVTPTLAHAQADRRLRHSRGLHVAVIDGSNHEWQGRLLDVAADAITVEIDSAAHRFAITDVKRVDAHGDRVWDGALKGALFGAILGLAIGAGDSPGFVAQGALSYALVGVALDAMQSCNHTVYRAKPITMKVSW
jgi:hypothetical protein